MTADGAAAGGGVSNEAPPRVDVDGGTTTLVAGTSFSLSAVGGDITAGGVQGLFVDDTRVVSGWRLRIDGAPVEPLGLLESERFRTTFVGRTPPRTGRADATLLVARTRSVGDGMVEEVTIRNLAAEAAGLTVELEVEADFADLFEVKESRVDHRPRIATEDDGLGVTFVLTSSPHRSRMRVVGDGDPVAAGGTFRHTIVVPGRSTWRTRWTVAVALGPHDTLPSPDDASPEHEASRRMARWRLSAPVPESPFPGLETTLHTSTEDLGALQIADPAHPDRRVVAAGAPWFMALFGRDSLLTSLMALPVDQELALGTLRMLADLQGTRVDPITEEEPGRIVHEVRCGREGSVGRVGSSAYYGTVDATPLFVVLLGELHRWGLPTTELRELLPAADRALAWARDHGDRDGDGFVEYRRASDRGLVNQGWKDSFDGITAANGRIAEPPIALAEVQGYVYAAHCARAELAEAVDDPATATDHRRRAAELRERFDECFWLPDRGWYATALDGEKKPVDALTSNIGHCLWSGIVPPERAGEVARALVGKTMWTGFGVRTLAADMGAYNPMGYHSGSVWPHDNALVAAGLMRYGFVAEAQQVALGILDAARAFGGRLPELFCGFDRDEFPAPVPYPTSCSPQAWAAATPVSLLRTLLRFHPDLRCGRLGLAPALPEAMLPFRVGGVPLAGSRLELEVDADGWQVSGLPPHVTAVPTPPGRP
ncbi:glycogen debranching N-terminal domain-containing protein [Actinomycetospora corticicola]|uniref:Glycogen debranching enzyme n=1 Tax=Actinomycetospora corticicola TaxID=663602 RepID=A0A7Y9DTK8_9PSEU|nr:glycogen debranching enzyme [Actinomycetospora corticicola]